LLLNSNAYIGQFINIDCVRKTIEEHAAGRANKRLLIWSLLCFEWWLRRFQSGAEVGVQHTARAA
jgi:asparagine synthase (glutamine-hydrolysing)